ncbi:flagellar hook-length control protein FliK [Methylocaldum sp.]|uniref:flagellar hook-length control protein FliK n=1 Tax=Methylocaldum sp. TaxID=1969727 RepID=UPI002D303D4E|nr:flagellar hook-length control protein FliK [Methylocaldum sp.]HYE37822.1 flagellar hook-length control protein FliK [Methylocaldum sp.]
MKGDAPTYTVGEGAIAAPAEKDESRTDPLQELLQYLSNLERFSAQQVLGDSGDPAIGGSGLPGDGNQLPETASREDDSRSEKLSTEPLLATLAAYLVPLASEQSESPDLGDGEALISQTSAENTSAFTPPVELEKRMEMLGDEISEGDDFTVSSQELLASHLSSDVLDTHGSAGVTHREQIASLSKREGSSSLPAEGSSSGAVASGAEDSDILLSQLLAAETDDNESIKSGAVEGLVPQFDKKSSALNGAAAEGSQPPIDADFSMGAMPAISQISTVVASDSVPALDKPLNQPGWQDGLGERIIWMADKTLQTAEIKLNPAHLGPLEIRIQMDQDQATIHFSTHHASVREAIEAATPKLREMLGAQQITLADINVTVPSGLSDERGSSFDFHQQQSRFGDRSQPFSEQVSEKNESALTESGRPMTANGLLNLYA